MNISKAYRVLNCCTHVTIQKLPCSNSEKSAQEQSYLAPKVLMHLARQASLSLFQLITQPSCRLLQSTMMSECNSEVGSAHSTHEVLGEGTFGKVTKHFDIRLDRSVAVKTIPKAAFQQRATQAKSARQPKDEFDILSTLSHSNILKTFHCHEDANNFYITCEYVPHPTWFDILDNVGPCEERQTLVLMRQACGAVSYMHDMNVIHRDLKPENILVNIEKLVLTIIDLGNSKIQRDRIPANTVRGSSVVGSGMYTAPEVYLFHLRYTDGFYTSAVDMWSMGMLLYVSWTGCSPMASSVPHAPSLDHVRTAEDFSLMKTSGEHITAMPLS